MGTQSILFMAGFLIVLAIYITLIRLVARRLDSRIHPHTYSQVERLIITGIIAGIFAMFQPWIFVGYKYGFLLLLFSTLSFIVWSHVTPAITQYGDQS